MKNFICLALSLVFLASCGSLPKQVEEVKNKEKRGPSSHQPEFPEQEALATSEELTQRIESIVKSAQEAGPESVEFLSSDLFLKANDSSLRGDAQTAAFLLRYIHQMNPEDMYVRKKWAIELIRIGKLKEAQFHLDEIFEKEKESDEVTGLILGGVHTALQQNDKAQATYQKILKLFPKSEEACIFLSKSYALEKKEKKAFDLLNDCEKRMPQATIFPYYKGKMAVDAGRVDEGLKYFGEALKRDPEYSQAVLAIGMLYEQKEIFDKAIDLYKQFLVKQPMNYNVLGRIVQLLFNESRYQEIIPYAQRLTSLDPTDINLKVRLGILYTDAKRYEDAKGIFKEILITIPDSDRVLFYLGSLYQETKKYDEAIEYFSKIPSESALFLDGHLQIAQMLQTMAMNDKTRRQEFFSFVDKTQREHPSLKFDLTVILSSYYEHEENFEDAIQTLEALVDEEKFTDGHRYYLAALHDKNGNYKQAIGHIQAILSTNPNHAHALNFLGYSMVERGEDLSVAYDYIKRAVELRPEDGYIRDSLGWYYYTVGEYDKALVELKKAWELVQTDVIISKHLALIYQKMEKYDLAEKYLQEALRHSQFEADKNKVQKALEDLQQKRLPASERP